MIKVPDIGTKQTLESIIESIKDPNFVVVSIDCDPL